MKRLNDFMFAVPEGVHEPSAGTKISTYALWIGAFVLWVAVWIAFLVV